MTLTATLRPTGSLSGVAEHREEMVQTAWPLLGLALLIAALGSGAGFVIAGIPGTALGFFISLFGLGVSWQKRTRIIERTRFG